MATQRPTLKEIIERVEQDLTSRLGSSVPPRVALTRVLARAEAGIAHALYGYIDTKEKNFFPDTGDEASVLRWANLFNITRLAPVAATGTVQVTGTNGSIIPAGRQLQTPSGALYAVDVDSTVIAGVALVAVTAVDRGSAGNLNAGVAVSFTQPVAGVLSTAIVQSPGIAGGGDIETIEALRVRVLDRMKAAPKGGSSSDYVKWAEDAHPDVTRVWVAGQEMYANSVTVRIVTDDAPGGLIPGAAVLNRVAEYISARAPVTADVYVVAPTAVPLDLAIAIQPSTQAVKDAVTAELVDLVKREAEPGGTILLSRINEAISNAAGESDHQLISPTTNVEHEPGDIAVLGDITWSDL